MRLRLIVRQALVLLGQALVVSASCPGNGSTLLSVPAWRWDAVAQSEVSRQGHVGAVLTAGFVCVSRVTYHTVHSRPPRAVPVVADAIRTTTLATVPRCHA